MYKKLCIKCDGDMYIDGDKNLHCMMCGKIIHLDVRRAYDSRRGKIRDNKKAFRGTNVGFDSEPHTREIRRKSTSDLDSTLTRQRGLGQGRRTLTTRR